MFPGVWVAVPGGFIICCHGYPCIPVSQDFGYITDGNTFCDRDCGKRLPVHTCDLPVYNASLIPTDIPLYGPPLAHHEWMSLSSAVFYNISCLLFSRLRRIYIPLRFVCSHEKRIKVFYFILLSSPILP